MIKLALLIFLAGFVIWFVWAYRRENGWQGVKVFETDECSGYQSRIYRFFTKKRLPWADECVLHDVYYHAGGSAALRLEADKKLKAGVVKCGYPFWALAMYAVIRLGGVWWLPTTYRWNYGTAYQLPWNIRTEDGSVARIERTWVQFFKKPIFGKTVWTTDNEGVKHYTSAEYYKLPYLPECICNLVKRHESGHLAGIKGSWKCLDIMWEAPGKMADTIWEKLAMIVVGPVVLVRLWVTGSWFSKKNQAVLEKSSATV